MFRQIMIFAHLVYFIFLPTSNSLASPTSLKAISLEYAEVVNLLSKEKTWRQKIEGYRQLSVRVRADLVKLDYPLAEDELELASSYIELNSLMMHFPASSLKKSQCSTIGRRILGWSNPQANSESEATEAGRWLISLIRTLCDSQSKQSKNECTRNSSNYCRL